MHVTAVVLRQYGLPRPYAESRPLQVEHVALDPHGHGEILVKVVGARLRHSDLSIIDGSPPRPLPLVLGHEGAGEIVESITTVRDDCLWTDF